MVSLFNVQEEYYQYNLSDTHAGTQLLCVNTTLSTVYLKASVSDQF